MWLNPDDSPSTGNMVIFDGEEYDEDGKEYDSRFDKYINFIPPISPINE